MVDDGTWSRLDDAEQQEFRALLAGFQESLRRHGVEDGFELATEWSVTSVDGLWSIARGATVLEGVTSRRREVVAALYADGVQNLNR